MIRLIYFLVGFSISGIFQMQFPEADPKFRFVLGVATAVAINFIIYYLKNKND